MFEFIWKWFGLKWLKKVLDKLPANGRKTAIGVVIVLLSVATTFFPEHAAIIQSAIDFLKDSFESSPVLTSGAIAATIGFLHKLLKALETLLMVAQAEEAKKEATA